jgi:hypothetical protein
MAQRNAALTGAIAEVSNLPSSPCKSAGRNGCKPWIFAVEISRRNLTRGIVTSYWLPRFSVVKGTASTKARGRSSSSRETISTGLTLAAIPKSARYTSPGLIGIKAFQNFSAAVSRLKQFILGRLCREFEWHFAPAHQRSQKKTKRFLSVQTHLAANLSSLAKQPLIDARTE